MFKGVFEATLDDKNRVVLPAKFRNRLPDGMKLEDGFTLTRGRGGRYLELHPTPKWEADLRRKNSQWQEHDEIADTVEAFLRLYCGGAVDVELDKSFRFVIPELERKDAHIEKEVVFVGVIDKIELWSKFRFEAWREAHGHQLAAPRLPTKPAVPTGGEVVRGEA